MNEGRTHPLVLVAAVALLNRDGKVLIGEILEELGVEIARADLVPLTFASHAYQEFHLLMPLYLCRRWLGSVVAQEDQELRWVKPNELSFYDMPPADEPLKTTLPKLL